MSDIKWTNLAKELAKEEGWFIDFEVTENEDPFIRSIGTNEMFDDSEDALIYVRNMAEHGSELHINAMLIVNESFTPNSNKKLLLGLTPKSIWMKLRLKDIKEAVNRYEEAGKEIPKEWLEEAGELALKLENWE